MDQDKLKEELNYRVELAKYYALKGKDEFQEKLPKWAQYTIIGVVLVLFFSMAVSMCSGGGSNTQTEQNTTQAEEVIMPNVTNLDRTEAERRLNNAGINNIQETPRKDLYSGDTNDTDIIVDQAPKSGTKMKVTDKIILSYGSKKLYEKSKTTAAVPNIVGFTIPHANEELKKAGFVKINYPPSPSNLSDHYFVVKSMTPTAGTKIPQNQDINLITEQGFEFNQTKADLKENFMPYDTFESINNPDGRDIELKFKKQDKSLKTQKDMDKKARLLKIAIEKVLGENIGNVSLINPNVKFVGNSKDAELKSTNSGITLSIAENACENAGNNIGGNFKVDWDNGMIAQKVTDTTYSLTANASADDESGTNQQYVMSCVVGGDSSTPDVQTFNVQ